MALQDFSSDARLAQAALFPPHPIFCTDGGLSGRTGDHNASGVQGMDLEFRAVAQADASSRVPSFCCSGREAAVSFYLWAGRDRLVSVYFKNQDTLSCSLAFQHLLHSSAPMSRTPVAIVCFLPTPTSLFTLSEERGDGSTFFPSSSPVKKNHLKKKNKRVTHPSTKPTKSCKSCCLHIS